MDDAMLLRGQIQAALPECIPHIVEIIKNTKGKAHDRLRAFEALADRGGLPAVRAQISQNISAGPVFDIIERRKDLISKQEAIKQEIENLRSQLAIPAPSLPRPNEDECYAIDEKGENDSTKHEEGIRGQKGETGLLQFNQRWEDQGSTPQGKEEKETVNPERSSHV